MHTIVRSAVAIAVVALAVAACSGPDVRPTAVAPTYQPSGLPSIAWTPSVRVPKVTMSDDEKAAARLRSLDQEREGYGLPPMEYPSLRRWIYPEEIASVTVPCMADKGFVVSANPGGYGVSGGVPSAQNQAFGRAMLECKAMYSIDPRVESQQHMRQRGELAYEYVTQFVIPCLRRHGLEVADWPSLETWLANPIPIDGYPSKDPVIAKECPYNPPTAWLIGEG